MEFARPHMDSPACNPHDFVQHKLPAQELQPRLLSFERGEMLNPYALSVLETIEPFFPHPYRYFVEFPLQLLCSKDKFTYLPIELWRFWVNSRVDIAVMYSGTGIHCRKACLAFECQSPWHNLEDVQKRDRIKAQILASTGIPLVYVQYTDYPRVLRFWLADDSEDLLYNPFTQEGRTELAAFLKKHCL
jgi:hypothetical protein